MLANFLLLTIFSYSIIFTSNWRCKMCTASIYEARNKLSDYVKIAESGEPVQLTRYNKPVAVIISFDEFDGNNENKESWLLKWRKENAQFLDNEGIPLPPKVYLDPNRKIFED